MTRDERIDEAAAHVVSAKDALVLSTSRKNYDCYVAALSNFSASLSRLVALAKDTTP